MERRLQMQGLHEEERLYRDEERRSKYHPHLDQEEVQAGKLFNSISDLIIRNLEWVKQCYHPAKETIPLASSAF